ncbi:MAG TPA: hypothetical protein VG963_26745, partial [Polyangiaceae bacterium]|nr:hypothetical protein [Polyangiaceae bacterium]
GTTSVIECWHCMVLGQLARSQLPSRQIAVLHSTSTIPPAGCGQSFPACKGCGRSLRDIRIAGHRVLRPERVRATNRADELMLSSQIFDHAARLRSFEIAAAWPR